MNSKNGNVSCKRSLWYGRKLLIPKHLKSKTLINLVQWSLGDEKNSLHGNPWTDVQGTNLFPLFSSFLVSQRAAAVLELLLHSFIDTMQNPGRVTSAFQRNLGARLTKDDTFRSDNTADENAPPDPSRAVEDEIPVASEYRHFTSLLI